MRNRKPNLPQDYTVRRKRIYKGRYAPDGTLFLELTVRKDGNKYKAVQHVPGGLGAEREKQVITVLYLQILRDYFPAEYMKLNPDIKRAFETGKKNNNRGGKTWAKFWALVRRLFKIKQHE